MAKMMPLRWQIGSDTDIGGGKENQDESFVWSSIQDATCVLCVLDGHGRDVGKVAAMAAKSCLQEFFEEHHSELKTSPYDCLVRAHEVAHVAIMAQFKIELELQGYDVMQSPEGYLLKSKKGRGQWFCIHGGTTCSICALVDGYLYIANVGDSSGLLCSTIPLLSKADLIVEGDAAVPNHLRNAYTDSIPTDDSDLDDKLTSLIITAEHSPESPYEFLRLRGYRVEPHSPHEPSLNIVYDSPAHEKAKCPPVFSLGPDGLPIVNRRGCYYKNVRKEWASLVSTPTSAKFQDALAFTRSLGDLHLHTYGVTHLPEVKCINLVPLLNSLQSRQRSHSNCRSGSESSNGSTDSTTSTSPDSSMHMDPPDKDGVPMLCLVLATDGVWDNWTYEDLTRFVMDPSCLNAATTGADGAHRVALSLMQRNAMFSKKNFGIQADNATSIIMYISQSELLPAVGFETAKSCDR